MKLLMLNSAGVSVELTGPAKEDLRRRLKSLLDSADDVRESLAILRARIDLLPNRKPLRSVREDIDDITHKVNRLLNNTDVGQITLLLDSDS